MKFQRVWPSQRTAPASTSVAIFRISCWNSTARPAPFCEPGRWAWLRMMSFWSTNEPTFPTGADADPAPTISSARLAGAPLFAWTRSISWPTKAPSPSSPWTRPEGSPGRTPRFSPVSTPPRWRSRRRVAGWSAPMRRRIPSASSTPVPTRWSKPFGRGRNPVISWVPHRTPWPSRRMAARFMSPMDRRMPSE